MEFAVFALFLALLETIEPASTELQSLLIFTTATANDREIEELRGKWSKLGTFESAYSSQINDLDQQNFWTILLSRGEPDVLFADIQKAIQADDRTKVIVGRPNGIIDRIFLSPFCWRRGATEQMAFVMCNGKLEFPIDDRGWEIDEKVEVNGAMRREIGEGMGLRRSVWIDLLPGVRMATASPLQKQPEKTTKSANKKSAKHSSKKYRLEKIEEKITEKEEEHKGEKEEQKKQEMEEEKNEEENDEENMEDGKEQFENEEKEEQKGDEENDEEEDDDGFDGMDEAEKKRKCRYRLSCYSKNGIELSEKQWERHQHVLSGKLAPPKGEKSTMKNAANAAVKRMKEKEAEGRVLREKHAKDGEKVLADYWTELERKNKCKYRKSCYQTGKVPEIERSAFIEWLGGEKGKKNRAKEEEDAEDGEGEKVKKYEEMNDYERKVHCRYRQSCYGNGVRPNIDNGLGFLRIGLDKGMKAMKSWWWELEKKKHEREERGRVEGHDHDEKPFSKLSCKYRKSCYESGMLPAHLRGAPKPDPEEEHAAKVLGGKKVPTSVKELKLFCKYRKSCYLASAAEKSGEDEKKEGRDLVGIIGGHNETKMKNGEKAEEEGEIEAQPIRKAKANSGSRGGAIKNGGEEDEEQQQIERKKKEEGREEARECGESNKKQQKTYLVPRNVEKSIGRKRRKSAAVSRMGRGMKEPEKEEEKQEQPIPVRVERRKERKHKKYTILDEVKGERGPVNEESDEEEEEEKRGAERMEMEKREEKRRRGNEAEEEEEKQNDDEEDGAGGAKEGEDGDGEERRAEMEGEILPERMAEWEKEIGGIERWKRMDDKERMLRCRYRKSCYAHMNRASGLGQKMKQTKGARDDGEGRRNKKAEKSPVAPLPPPPPQFVDMNTKLQCKYRKSCYASGDLPKIMDRIVAEEAGQRNWTGEGRCNPWRISCRQAMGLPIREKAPIGPNGKRLCRRKEKRKTDGTDG